jgi:hypothetical protein
MAFTDDVIAIMDDVAPEFSGVDLSKKQRFVGYASEEHREDMPRREIATAYLTAHMLELSDKSVAGGTVAQVKRERVDDLEIEYAITDSSENALLSTKYGTEYMRIIRAVKPSYSFVTSQF